MIPINKHLFDLSEVFANWKHQETWYTITMIKLQRLELIDCLQHIKDNSLYDGHYKEERDAILMQLHYVDINISTLEDALLCHETKIFEKRSQLGELGIIGLN